MTRHKGIEMCYCGVREQEVAVSVIYDKGLQDSDLLTGYRLKTQKFSAVWHLNTLFNIWGYETNSFMLELSCGDVRWRIIKNNRGCFYVQFKNDRPISGFDVPKDYWGFKQGLASTPTLVGVLGDTCLIVPQAHCLNYSKAKNIISQILFSDEGSPRLSYDPSLWEETNTYKVDPEATNPLDKDWQEAIGYHPNPDYHNWSDK